MSVLIVIIILSVLVIIHELGHLIAALWAKVKAEEFGIGYPPKIWTMFTWRKIPFTLNAIPFGGFVRMKGEDAEPGQAVGSGDFRAASLPKRVVIILAGVTMNMIFGIAVLSIIYTITGIPTPISGARIGYIAPGSPAESSGLQTDTQIISMQGQAGSITNPTPQEVQAFVATNQGNEIAIITQGPCQELQCGETAGQVSLRVRTTEEVPEGQGLIGIGFVEQAIVRYPLWQMPFRGAAYGFIAAVDLGKEILMALWSVIISLGSGQVPADVVGPIGIAGQAEQMKLAEQGWVIITLFAAMISINLAIMNILPIPPLDGGKLLFILLEPFVKKSWLTKAEYWANYSGFVVLIGLIIAISAKDLWQLFGG